VVIPTHNRAGLLAQTLATVFDQEPREVIVVDDGSTDATAEYLESVDVSVLRNQRGAWGPSRARNEGFKHCETELVAFLDSDDLLLPGALARLERALLEEPSAPFAFGRSLTGTKEGGHWQPTGLMTVEAEEMKSPLPSLFVRNFVPSVGTVARTAAVRQIGGYPERTVFAEDHYFWLRLAQLGDPVFVPLLTSLYRVHAGNRHSTAGVAEEVDEYLKLAHVDPRLSGSVPAYLGVVLCNSFTAAASAGDSAAVLKALRWSLLGRRHRATIVRHAVDHWKDRRRWVREGLRLWEGDDELKDWLAQH
jgi:glycosyltransferase involved in cell wall biosynthesis